MREDRRMWRRGRVLANSWKKQSMSRKIQTSDTHRYNPWHALLFRYCPVVLRIPSDWHRIAKVMLWAYSCEQRAPSRDARVMLLRLCTPSHICILSIKTCWPRLSLNTDYML